MQLLSRAVCNIIGNLFPAYASYKAVLSKDAHAHRQWLMYWIVNTFFIVFEMFADVLGSWLPLYYEAKIVFIIWLTLPQFQGAALLYTKFIEPAMRKYEGEIDQGIAKAQEVASQHVGRLGDAGTRFLRTQGAELLRRGSKFVGQASAEAAAALARQQAAAATAAPADDTTAANAPPTDEVD